MVKRTVKNHSIPINIGPKSLRIGSTLSSRTVTTLIRIDQSSTTSNAFPAGVSASKITSYR